MVIVLSSQKSPRIYASGVTVCVIRYFSLYVNRYCADVVTELVHSNARQHADYSDAYRRTIIFRRTAWRDR